MTKLMILGAMVFSLLTLVEPVWAQSDSGQVSAKLEDMGPTELSEMPMHLNPQIGVSSFEYSGQNGNSKQRLSGGATIEFGGPMRRMETGLLIMQTGAQALNQEINSTYLTIPMTAKIRVAELRAQSWYVKFGFLTAFQINTNDRADTNPIDILGSLGVGDRLAFHRNSDFIIEASFNRGLLDAIHSTNSSYNQGFLVMAGMSFSI